MNNRRAIAFGIAFLMVSGAVWARGNPKELTIPLKFKPQEGVNTTTADLPPSLLNQAVEIRVEDARKLENPLNIGQGTGGNDKVFPVLADHDVIPYVAEVVKDLAKGWSLKVEQPAARVLVLQLLRFSVDESNKALGSMYATEAKLGFTLKDGRGKTLADGAGSGSAHRYGRAHNAENINEVLSDALKEAFGNVMADKNLQTAWTTGTRSGRASAEAAPSAEERLRKLDDLLKKGLITKSEYDRKRAEILKDM